MISNMFFKIHDMNQKARIILWLIILVIVSFTLWAFFSPLDEVAIGEGRVIPSRKSQIIQNLEGGILSTLLVKEGQIVQEGEILAELDQGKARSALEETSARIAALKARAARLEAEINDADLLNFPKEIAQMTEIIEREKNLFVANRRAFYENLDHLQEQLQIANDQLTIAQPLLKSGAASAMEILRLQQNVAEFSARLSVTKSQYFVSLRDDYAKTMNEIEPLEKIREGLQDQLDRTLIVSPLHGIIKDIRVTTIGGVIASGSILMEVIPIEDQLLIETRLNPRDIAFIHSDQSANVKITAYDSAIYGSLPALVTTISPDTIEDNTNKQSQYYRVYVLTNHNYLETKDGKHHPIRPGMVATVEIKTGNRTVLSYLLKPLNRAAEALRER